MINEDRVKELYAIAQYEGTQEQKNRQMGQYFRDDYVWKELFKSFFLGSIAYAILIVFWGLANSSKLGAIMNGDSITILIITVILTYIAFMLVYMLVTYFCASKRYAMGRKELKRYSAHLKKVNQMYCREEKLKK